MSKFERCLEKVLQFEGHYSNDPKDPGGETFKGIARSKHPNWEGWKAFDVFKKLHKGPPTQEVRDFDGLVASFYEDEFWFPLRGDYISDPKIAQILLDTAVNCGLRRAVSLLQKSLNACGHYPALEMDGVMGDKTIEALRDLSQAQAGHLPFVLTASRIRYYLSLQNPTYQRGWINRALTVAGL